MATERDDDRLVGARYRLIRPLGTGGSGTVYLARDTQENRRVALKIMAERGLIPDEKIQRFQLEFEALSGLDHPGVVRVLDRGDEEGRHYLVMEYLPGVSLAELIGTRAPTRREVLGYLVVMRSVFDALHYLHRHHIIHRDLKPANIRITRDNQVKVVDFGLIKLRSRRRRLTSVGETLGTAAYMSPEQARGDTMDHRSDLYSAGVCLYHCVTAVLPFEDTNPIVLASKHNLDMPSTPSFLNPNVPSDVEDLIIRLMEKNKNKRLVTAREAVETIDEILAYHRSIEPPSPIQLAALRLGHPMADTDGQGTSLGDDGRGAGAGGARPRKPLKGVVRALLGRRKS